MFAKLFGCPRWRELGPDSAWRLPCRIAWGLRLPPPARMGAAPQQPHASGISLSAAWTHARHRQHKAGSDPAAAKGRDGSSRRPLARGPRQRLRHVPQGGSWRGLACHRPGCPGSGGSGAAAVPAPLRGEGGSLPPPLRGGVRRELRTAAGGEAPVGDRRAASWRPGTRPPPLQPAGREICGPQGRGQPRTARSGPPVGNGTEVTRG